ncbi:hypothetical protein TCAL_01072 [Tigriopus californicus]|uniref:Major facilitator superfamily (MFS) profile domain-containing protein n=1 Tax=Tigriopus californicus TaxID=6832 RepID=A0A553P2A3_TIGCA|nr:facilitated trehalose transporter Tret1-like isoform X2 [Tigriopus californicus]TRY71827.1 hypothetical protein TCAL_01072 [Tigriopus californicus]
MTRTYNVKTQVFATLSISVTGFCTGTYHSFSAVVIPKIKRPLDEGGWNISLEQGSWIASLFFIGTIVGSLLGGTFNQAIGAKRVINLVSPFIFVAWILATLAHSVEFLYVSRILLGTCYGIFLAVVKVYTAEITHPDFRGVTSAFYSVQLSTGLLYGFLLGYFLEDWRLVTAFMALPSLALFFLSLFIPDSPYWLVEKNQCEKARKELKRLRGSRSNYEAEFHEILTRKREKDTLDNEEQSDSGMRWISVGRSSRFWKPFLKIGVLMCLSELAGMNVLAQYMVIVFDESGSSVAPELAPIIVASVRLGIACISTVVLRYSPRKPLFLLCCVVICLSYVAMGSFTYLKSDLDEHTSIGFISAFGWIPLTCLVAIQGSQTIGFLSIIHFNLQAESFSTEIRSFGCGLLGVVTSLARFATTKLFPQMISWFGLFGVFYFFAGVMLVILCYTFVIMPENKGQSLVHTESKLNANKL